jgi:hypothetical protein
MYILAQEKKLGGKKNMRERSGIQERFINGEGNLDPTLIYF